MGPYIHRRCGRWDLTIIEGWGIGPYNYLGGGSERTLQSSRRWLRVAYNHTGGERCEVRMIGGG